VKSPDPDPPIGQRVCGPFGRKVSGREIGFLSLDIATSTTGLVDVFCNEQRAGTRSFAPFAEASGRPCYSLADPGHQAYTVDKNIRRQRNNLRASP